MAVGALSAPRSAAAPRWRFRSPSVLPGFNLAFGYAVIYLGLIVLIPLAALVLRASTAGLEGFWQPLAEPRVAAALRVSFGLSLRRGARRRRVRPARRLGADALPLLRAASSSTRRSTCLSRCRRRSPASRSPRSMRRTAGSARSLAPLGIKVAYTPLGIFVALVFVGLPFTVRTVQPLIAEIDRELEEAAATLGASRTRAVWTRADPAAPAGDPHRLRARLRARGRRIRLGDLHRRQHPLRVGDRAAAHHHQARGVRLYGRHRDRDHHAGDLVPDASRRSTCCRPTAGGGSGMAEASPTPDHRRERSERRRARRPDRRRRCLFLGAVPDPAARRRFRRGAGERASRPIFASFQDPGRARGDPADAARSPRSRCRSTSSSASPRPGRSPSSSSAARACSSP